MFKKLLLLFTIVPIIEIYLLIKIGGVVGSLPTILFVILTAVLGAKLVKSAGASVMVRVQQSLQMQGNLTDSLLDGVVLVISGVLLVTPGVFTDMFALLLHFAPFKNGFKKFLKNQFTKHLSVGGVSMGDFNDLYNNFGMGGDPFQHHDDEDIVETEGREIDNDDFYLK